MIVGQNVFHQNIIWDIHASKVKILCNWLLNIRNYFFANVYTIVYGDVDERVFGNVPGSNNW
jgi:hypothetical protein